MKSLRLLLVLLAAACTPPASAPPAASGASAPGAASTPQLREERATKTLDRLAAKDFDGVREWFDGPLRNQFSPKMIEDTWTQTEADLGPYQSRAFNGALRVRGLASLEYDLAFAKGHVKVHVTFNDDGTIAGLWIAAQGQ